jgi:hypothetical protein
MKSFHCADFFHCGVEHYEGHPEIVWARLGRIYLSAWGKPEGPILFNPFILGKKLGTLGNYLPITVT